MYPSHHLFDRYLQEPWLPIQDPSRAFRYSPITWAKVRFLGKGSYGSVTLAVSTNSGSPFGLLAVKSANVRGSSTLMKEEMIFREFANSPGVVRCFGSDLSFENGEWFYNLLLEYASGGTLQDLMQRSGGKFPESDVQKYTRMILRGLYCIHKKGYVHCDLKPENILVFHSPEGACSLKISDFGLSKIPGKEDELCPRKFHFRGTPLYMSPESVLLGEIKSSLDIWSLGCIVVEMISGRRLWDCNGEEPLMSKIVRRSPKIPEAMSEIGKDFLRRCFERETAKRWTAEMLLQHPFLIETESASCGFTYCLLRSGNTYSSEKLPPLPPPPGFESVPKRPVIRRTLPFPPGFDPIPKRPGIRSTLPPPPGFDPIPKRPVVGRMLPPPPGFDPIPKRPMIYKKLPPPGFSSTAVPT